MKRLVNSAEVGVHVAVAVRRVGLMNEYRAAWALIRQWAGLDAAVAKREAEIQRLERLVWDAVYALQKAGADSEAARLRRAIEKRS